MKIFWKIFLFIFSLLNWWLLKIPSRFSFIALVGNFLIIRWFQDGRPLYMLERDLRGVSEFVLFTFWIAFGWPMFWAFICCWSASKMASSGFIKSNSSALDKVIDFRNGQMSNKTAQDSFEILKKTSSLDLMKANDGNPTFAKALNGFNALHSNSTPQKVYKDLTSKD